MLTACGVLNNKDNIKAWYNVLPKGIILGYNIKVNITEAEDVLFKFNTLLKSSVGIPLSHEEIGNKWCKYSREVADMHGSVSFVGRYNAAFYTFIYDDLCFKGSRKEYRNWYGTVDAVEYIEGITSMK